MAALAVGAKAPDFDFGFQIAGGSRLSDLRGQPVVVYFYPKDDTPACTVEAVRFSQLYPEFLRVAVPLIGISPDTTRKHQRFVEKYELAVPLIADPGREIIDRYGVWIEKSLFGRKYMGVERATFLIDRQGLIQHLWHAVRVTGHAEEVLAAAKSLADRR